MEQYAGFGLPDPWEPEDKYQKREKKTLKKEIAELKERLDKFEKSIPTPQECMDYARGNFGFDAISGFQEDAFVSGCDYVREMIERKIRNSDG